MITKLQGWLLHVTYRPFILQYRPTHSVYVTNLYVSLTMIVIKLWTLINLEFINVSVLKHKTIAY